MSTGNPSDVSQRKQSRTLPQLQRDRLTTPRVGFAESQVRTIGVVMGVMQGAALRSTVTLTVSATV